MGRHHGAGVQEPGVLPLNPCPEAREGGDLDELAEKLSGFKIAGTNAPKNVGTVGIIVTKPDGNDVMRRTLTMRRKRPGGRSRISAVRASSRGRSSSRGWAAATIGSEAVARPVRNMPERVFRGYRPDCCKISFKGFWAVSLALKVVFSDLRPAQGSRCSCG